MAESIIEKLNKTYGKGTLIGGKDIAENLEVVDSGSLTLNLATGIGGNPIGKLIEMFGPESSGKSTLSLHFTAEFQKAGKKCVLMDFEQSYDKKYAKTIGVDTENLVYCQPGSMEDGYNIAYELVKSGEIGLIVIDSHTAMTPQKVIEGDIGDAKMALQARINSEALLKIKPLLKPNNCTIVAIAQLRTNIGGYGDPNVPSGGNAYKFYSDMRYKVSKSADKEKELNKTTVEVIKNKCAAPFGKAEFKIEWGVGISREQEIIDLAVDFELLKKGGAGWYTVGDTKLQGDQAVKEFLRDNPEFSKELETNVLTKIKENGN